ncbi:Conserved_hypothetical protein [Hexamita inflata]|uniref:Uncharacterized protein n=1 Tax=Hexamita inflata TaxID=28002 RepID=A0AA86RZT4_9EUKA|nr:Conserved hypothetical protein [Hexamita inflata]
MQQLQNLHIIRTGALYWIQLSFAIQNIVEIIMMPPQQSEEYLLKDKFGHFLFKQGRFFGNDFICSMQGIMWHQFIAERYSYFMDFWYSISMRIISHGIPLFIMSTISYALGYIKSDFFFKQITFNSQWFLNEQACYELLGLNSQMCVIALAIYYFCQKFQLKVFKVFLIAGIASFIIRSLIICYYYSRQILHDYDLRYMTDMNTLTQFYHFSFGFAFGDVFNKYKVEPKMLYNLQIQNKISFKITKEVASSLRFLLYSLLILCAFVDSLIQLDAESKQISTRSLLIVRLLSKPIYAILLWILIISQELQCDHTKEIKPKKQCKRGQFLVPGYTQQHFSVLAAQPFAALIRLSVGQTVIGPYHPKIFIMITIGVLVFQHFLGQICMVMFNWFMQDIYGAAADYFDSRKRKRISQLIKESIYNGAE